jgi:hypothetical protein
MWTASSPASRALQATTRQGLPRKPLGAAVLSLSRLMKRPRHCHPEKSEGLAFVSFEEETADASLR